MSTVAQAAADPALRRPGLARLTFVELRKMVDTRAGMWLQITIVALSLLLAVITIFAGKEADHTLKEMLSGTIAPAQLLLPVVGILLVSSEWTQRTSVITFALVPHRSRIIVAKLLACVSLSLVALVVSIVIALIATAVAAPTVDDAWSFSLSALGQDTLGLAAVTVIGLAFGALLLASAPAIVLYFALPTAMAILGGLSFMEEPVKWINLAESASQLTDNVALSGSDWAHIATALIAWTAIPLAVGLWRITRDEIR
ncbi:MAG TPA: hypothetical protein VNT22_00300 [Baekduia sp.]|nr:hypothetical protein [Baekduia sp.]